MRISNANFHAMIKEAPKSLNRYFTIAASKEVPLEIITVGALLQGEPIAPRYGSEIAISDVAVANALILFPSTPFARRSTFNTSSFNALFNHAFNTVVRQRSKRQR